MEILELVVIKCEAGLGTLQLTSEKRSVERYRWDTFGVEELCTPFLSEILPTVKKQSCVIQNEEIMKC